LGGEAWLTLGIVFATLATLVATRIPPDLVFVAALTALMLTGVLTPPEALEGLANPGLATVAVLYVVVSGENHLRYLEKWGLLRQSGRPRAEREYSFTDLLTIKQVANELDRGTPLKVILRGLLAERQGQLALDFHAAPDTPRAKVVVLHGRRTVPAGVTSAPPLPADASMMVRDNSYQSFPFSDPQTALAAKYFIEGSRLDDGEDRNMEGAAAAYRKALVIDPDLVPAIVNLANIHYARDEMIEAQALYERAIGLDPDCFEAYFNLGNIHHDLSRYDDALRCYRGAVRLNGAYPDAHFYLAVTLEKTGHSPEAKAHWRAYQALAPDGEWADLAKEFSE
jgi:tetratricopeptide (TPR) repeat protein